MTHWHLLRPFAKVDAVNKGYPGRASIANHLDLLITLLSLGASGWRTALREREELFGYLEQRLQDVASANGAQEAHPLCPPDL